MSENIFESKFNDEATAQNYINRHKRPEDFAERQITRGVEVDKRLREPLIENHYKERGYFEFVVNGVKFLLGYRKIYPQRYAGMVGDEFGVVNRRPADNVLDEDQTLSIFPARYEDDRRWEYVVEILDMIISIDDKDDNSSVYRLRYENISGVKIYFNPNISGEECRKNPNHNSEIHQIFIPGDINSIAQILVLLHETGHAISSISDPEKHEKLRETRFDVHVRNQVPDAPSYVENLREERDADAYAIQNFKPFMRKIGIDSKDVKDFFDLRLEDITGLEQKF